MGKLSKRQESKYINAFKNSKIFSIYWAYKKPSINKINSYNKLLNQYKNSKSLYIIEYKILGFNSSYYTMGFYVYNYKLKIHQLIIETYANTYIINTKLERY